MSSIYSNSDNQRSCWSIGRSTSKDLKLFYEDLTSANIMPTSKKKHNVDEYSPSNCSHENLYKTLLKKRIVETIEAKEIRKEAP